MIRLHLEGHHSGYEVDDMGFDQANSLHSHGEGAFLVNARPSGADHIEFRRMSIAVSRVVRIEELPV
jgi:hypothetical protein